tara:strand:- start:1055 stop:1492 length:438 start_codon:yes stop_codon:yes gene_type:complete
MKQTTNWTNRDINLLKRRIKTLYGYGNLSKEHNYMKHSKLDLGEDLFNEVYDNYLKLLKDTITPSKVIQEERIKSMKSMMESIFTYGTLERNDSYLHKYYLELGEDVFNQTFEEYSKHLSDNYTVDKNVYRDMEGLSYNSLVLNK